MTTPRDPDRPDGRDGPEVHADRLREVLRAEADQIVPRGDGLMKIRQRVGERRARARWLVPVGVAAAVALIAGGVLGGLALTGEDDAKVVTPIGTPRPSVSLSVEPSTAPTQQSASATALPVYYVHDTGTAIRLYREFHRVTVTTLPAMAAAREALTVPATDSDYTSLWPAGSNITAYNRTGDLATVTLNAAAAGPFNGGSQAAHLTVQQLVWTVTAADTAAKRVRIVVDNGQRPTELWGSEDISKPLTRDPSYEVLGAVWVLAPTQGESVSSPVKISGQATVFEGTVSVEIRRGSTVVKRTTAQASTGGPGRGSWSVSVVLAPGDYVVRAYEASAKDGSVTNVDDKTFTVG